MRKINIISLIILLAVALSACGKLTPPTALETVEPVTAETAQPQATEAPTTIAAEVPTPIANPVCRVSEKYKMDPALEAVLPKGDREWSQGPDDAYVTIIEYSDFQ